MAKAAQLILATVFDTRLGPCAIAWSEKGVVGFQLPEAGRLETLTRVMDRTGALRSAVVPEWVMLVIDRVRKHLAGIPQDFSSVALDLRSLTDFSRRVLEATRKIPAGQTLTYGEVAQRAGSPGGARAVGRALGRNPIAVLIPCHRVVAAGKLPGGFSAFGGVATKAKLLLGEGLALAGV